MNFDAINVIRPNGLEPTSTGRILGYARVSTTVQDLAYQRMQLRLAGCVRIFEEKRSGKNLQRPQLHSLLDILCPGDMMVATCTDRVARHPLDMLNIVYAVRAAGANLRLIDEPFIDTTSEIADVVFFMMGWQARMARKRILENTAHGREMARERGVRFGRKPKLTDKQRAEIASGLDRGKHPDDLAADFGVSRSTIRRSVACLRPDVAIRGDELTAPGAGIDPVNLGGV